MKSCFAREASVRERQSWSVECPSDLPLHGLDHRVRLHRRGGGELQLHARAIALSLSAPPVSFHVQTSHGHLPCCARSSGG